MQRIEKYLLQGTSPQISLPSMSRLMGIHRYGGVLHLLAQIDDERPIVQRKFRLLKNGDPYDFKDRKYVGSEWLELVQYHLFEILG